MTAATTTTTPASQAQRSLLGRHAGPVWERGHVDLAARLAAAVNDPYLTSEDVERLLAAVTAARRRP